MQNTQDNNHIGKELLIENLKLMLCHFKLVKKQLIDKY